MERERASPTYQRGVATLVSVMVLFFVMALVAAYANRNLILEQRMALNYQQISTAHEANHQALSHLLTLFNAGKVDNACRLDPEGGGTMRERYLVINEEGRIDVPAASRGEKTEQFLYSPYTIACDRVRGGDWSCQCPADFKLNSVADDGKPRESYLARIRHYWFEVNGKSVDPAFTAVQPSADISRFGLSIIACSTASGPCGNFRNRPPDGALSSRVQSLVLLRALKMPPVSGLVARGEVDLAGGMAAVNNEASSGGVAIQAGAAVTGDRAQVAGPAGSAQVSSVVASEASLATANADQFFRKFFGSSLSDYTTQPAARKLVCADNCASALQAMVDGGAQIVHYQGNLTLSEDVTVGTVARPVVLLVNGSLTINSPLRIVGVVYSRDDVAWSNGSANPSVVQGALLTAGSVKSDKGATALYDGTVMNRLKYQAGSFVPLPGGALWDMGW